MGEQRIKIAKNSSKRAVVTLLPWTQTKGQLPSWWLHWRASTPPSLVPQSCSFQHEQHKAGTSRCKGRHTEPGKEGREQVMASEKRLRRKKVLWTSLEDNSAEDDLSMDLSPYGAGSQILVSENLRCAVLVPLCLPRGSQRAPGLQKQPG